MVVHNDRISIIGAGTLGGTIAYGLLMNSLAKEIVLIDPSDHILQGQVLDLSEAATGTSVTVRAGTFKEAGQSGLVIFTADTPQLPNEERQDWLLRSRRLLLSIAASMSPVHPEIRILVASEPVDVYVQSFQSYYPHVSPHRIFGIGTTLPTLRFRSWLTDMMHSDAVTDAFVIGNTENPIVVWNHAKVSNESLSKLPNLVSQRSNLEKLVSNYRLDLIRERKGHAWFGTAAIITRLTHCLMRQHPPEVWVLSVYIPQYDVCTSWPAMVGPQGIRELVHLPLSSDESALFRQNVENNIQDFETS
ncbi:NAD(P)-binding protein, partial [Backusella circina FSU 941]